MLREKIRNLLYEKKVLEIGNDTQNNFVLKEIIGAYKDESRAYNAGAHIERLYRQGLQDGSHIATTKSEVVADIYDEAVQVMKKERRHIQKNRLREFFGLKANRSKEQEIVDSFQASLIRVVPASKVLSMFKEKVISAGECKMILKNQGLSTEEIENVIKGISLEA